MPRKTSRRPKALRQPKKEGKHEKASRRPKKSHKRTKTHRRKTARRLKGGDYTMATIEEVNGTPVTKDALVTFPGGGTMSVPAYRQRMADLDRNGDQIYD